MSTTSTVTTLVEPDLTLDNDDKIANWICMLVTTCANGTLLCVTSFHQEDMVVMCEGLGWEHSKGVQWLTEIGTVLTFWSNSEMMAALHWLAATTVWHGDPIALHIWPPSTKKVRDYIAARDNCPSDAYVQAPGEGVEFQPSSEPIPYDGFQRTLTRHF